jgi:hypothetical protein
LILLTFLDPLTLCDEKNFVDLSRVAPWVETHGQAQQPLRGRGKSQKNEKMWVMASLRTCPTLVHQNRVFIYQDV